MIVFKFKTTDQMEACHNALVGSPGYIDSEILIGKDEDIAPGGFILVVGNDTDDDLTIEVN